MQHRMIILLSLVTASACAALASACGGTDASLDAGDDATTGDASNDAAQTIETGSDAQTTPDATPAPDAGCTKGAGCRACCAATYPDAEAFFTSAEETCACTTPGDCKTVCANTLCTGTRPKGASPCEACVLKKDAGGCFGVAATACAGNAECQQLAGCIASCGGGPSDAGGGG